MLLWESCWLRVWEEKQLRLAKLWLQGGKSEKLWDGLDVIVIAESKL